MAILVKVIGALPVLITWTFCGLLVTFTAWFWKVMPAPKPGANAIEKFAAWPVPVSATVCDPPWSLLTVRVADRAPAAEGVKCTLMLQVREGVTDVQKLVCWKSAALAPLTLMVRLSGILPVLV